MGVWGLSVLCDMGREGRQAVMVVCVCVCLFGGGGSQELKPENKMESICPPWLSPLIVPLCHVRQDTGGQTH